MNSTTVCDFCKMAKFFPTFTIIWVLVCIVANVKADADDESIDLPKIDEAIFGYPDEEITGALVDAYVEGSMQNPEELGTYYQGDLLIPIENRDNPRNGLMDPEKRWPNGVVPYEIKGKFTSKELDTIYHAFKEYHTKTCIRFRQRTVQMDYISIDNNSTGCWSALGRIGGQQQLNLQSKCLLTNGTTIHELMHAVGFDHEQNRYDRDDYVKVLRKNIIPEMIYNFVKNTAKNTTAFGIGYDYASIMHYSLSAFSKNKQKPSMQVLKNTPDAKRIGQRVGFSPSDICKINLMYKCGNRLDFSLF